jgi:hypothetical protein
MMMMLISPSVVALRTQTKSNTLCYSAGDEVSGENKINRSLNELLANAEVLTDQTVGGDQIPPPAIAPGSLAFGLSGP